MCLQEAPGLASAGAGATAASGAGAIAAAFACHVCSRGFQSSEQLKKHEQLSNLHKVGPLRRASTRLTTPDERSVYLAHMPSSHINLQENLAKLAASGVAYKDRAAERRIQNPGFVDPTAPGIAVRRHAGEEEDDEPYAADAVSCRWVLG